MTYVLVGLGNPGEEYDETRHNVGRMVVERAADKNDASEWKEDKKSNSDVAKGKIGKHNAKFVLPNTFMNRSGKAVASVGVTKKNAKNLIVVYDDIDLPFGKLRVSFGRGSGGHKGVDSIIRSVGTKDFVRLRVGISPTTPSGKIKKPQGEEKVQKFLLTKFTPKEQTALKKILKESVAALETAVQKGHVTAMNEFN